MNEFQYYFRGRGGCSYSSNTNFAVARVILCLPTMIFCHVRFAILHHEHILNYGSTVRISISFKIDRFYATR